MLGPLALLIAYILGAISGGNIRESGSGNIGATNVLRRAITVEK